MRTRIAYAWVLALDVACALACAMGVSSCHRRGSLDAARAACVEILADGHLEASGWFADAEGHVITAGHAVRRTDARYEILWPGHGRYSAHLVGADPGHDIGLLRAEGLECRPPFLRLAASVPPAGSRLQMYGMAQFRHGVWIGGQVARPEPTFNYYSHLRWPTRCYLVAAPAPPGVSGGPWIDEAGRVAGTQSGFINQGSASSGLAIVAPPDAIGHLLRVRGPVRRGTMGCGFEELCSQPAGFIRRLPKDIEGIITIPIEPGGPAARAGLTRESLIRAVDARPVRYQHEVIEILQAHRPGDVLTLDVWDADARNARTVRVTLEDVPP